MFEAVWRIRLVDGPVPAIISALALIAVLGLVARTPRGRRKITLVAGVAGAVAGSILGWLLWNQLNTFTGTSGLSDRFLLAISLAGLGVLAVIVSDSRVRRRWIGVVVATSVLLVAGAAGVNIQTNQFPAVGSLVGKTVVPDLSLPPLLAPSVGGEPSEWHQPRTMPLHGRVGSIRIPSVVSGFGVRDAVIYLPPAALVAHPPRLPVLVMLSGQPGIPTNMVSTVDMPTILDQFARTHRGLAPIVVIPDQLGMAYANPMCVDSPLGNSATYLSVDVPNWIRAHLNVMNNRTKWAIGGYSQGGTCSIQLGSRFPGLFGSIFDVSGEIAPHRGSAEATIAAAFGGSADAYEAAKPQSLIAAGAPFADTLAIFAVGATNPKYRRTAATLESAARVAGMRTVTIVAPHSGHEWPTVGYAVEHGLPVLCRNWGLE